MSRKVDISRTDGRLRGLCGIARELRGGFAARSLSRRGLPLLWADRRYSPQELKRCSMYAPADDTPLDPTTMTPLLILSLLASPGYTDCPGFAPPPMRLQARSCEVGEEVYVPQAGDIILFRNRNIFARAAYYITLSGSTTHVGLVVARPDGSLSMLEAMPGDPVVMGDLATRLAEYTGQVSVRRRKAPLTKEESEKLTGFACGQLGKPFHLLGLLVPPVSFPFRVFSKPVDPNCLERSRWICTSLVLRTCVAAGILCPDELNPEGACASDLATNFCLDLSCGWDTPERLVKPCK